MSELIIPTMETARQVFFLKTYVEHNVPLLFVGPTGTGKSAITNNFLLKLPKEKYIPSFINFSARTSANQTQDIIMSKLDRRRKGLFGPPPGKKALIFVGKTVFFMFLYHSNSVFRQRKWSTETSNFGLPQCFVLSFQASKEGLALPPAERFLTAEVTLVFRLVN